MQDKTELNAAADAVQCLVVVGDPGGSRIGLLQNTPAAWHGRSHTVAESTREVIRHRRRRMTGRGRT